MASRLVGHSNGPSPSESARQEVEDRRKIREPHRAELKKTARDLEAEGYRLMRAFDYNGAIKCFEGALKAFGSRGALWFSITKAHYNLGNWTHAEQSATIALQYDPTRSEVRYIRGVARIQLRKYAAAVGDLEAVLEYEPDYSDAFRPLDQATEKCPSSQKATEDDLWPSINHEGIDETEPDSDTTDCLHVGDGVPCQHYNRKKCGFGSQCYHSHAPDEHSWRDRRGKNVCIHYMMGSCPLGDQKCKYSHVKDYLPPFGWYSKPERVAYIRGKFQAAAKHEQNAPKTLIRRIRHDHLPAWFWKDDEDEVTSEPVVALPDHLFAPALHLRTLHIAPPSPSSTDEFVLVLTLDDHNIFSGVYTHLLSTLKSKTRVVIASDAATALARINSSECVAIFVGDIGITRRSNSAVLTKFVDYIKKGGTGAVGGTFSSFVTEEDGRAFFNDALGLPWKRGSYFRTTFSRNTSNDVVQRNPSLEASYSMKALHLAGLRPGEAVYYDGDENEAPIVSTTIGKGRLAYLGDVNGEDESTKAALALLGLLDAPHPIPAATAPPTQQTQLDLHSYARPKGTTKPFIMILSLGWEENFEGQFSELYSQLKEKVEVLHGLSIDRVLDLLPSPGLTGIFVTSPQIMEKQNSLLVPALGAYVKSGGILVFGGLFSGHARFDKFTGFIQNLAGFNWNINACTGSSMVLNGKHSLCTNAGAPPLPKELHTKAIYINGITPEMSLYVAAKGEQYFQPFSQITMAPIIYAKCGEGWLGIVGDVNWSKANAQIVLAMFGLKVKKR